MTKYSVLVTGASTGIGEAIALDMAKHGHQVFAGVRKASDGEKLKSQNSAIVPLILDVTKSETIESATREFMKLREQGNSVALVNNAGIALPGPVEAMTVDQFRRMFDVNFFGLVEMTQALLPVIRETKGRIVNMSSVSGIVAAPLFGGYAATKFAVEALSDSLRREVGQFGVKVIAIEPGVIKTPIWDKGIEAKDQLRGEMREEALAPYEESLDKLLKTALTMSKHAIPPSRVADTVREVLSVSNPPARKVVVSASERIAVSIAKAAPTSLIDRILEKQIFRV